MLVLRQLLSKEEVTIRDDLDRHRDFREDAHPDRSKSVKKV
ncbi:hypothetical protein [Micromonospora sonneratiae]|uniref:Uncharacterized protein n=1 Tax=Micromonospora sonneratiae TaxID=1184706 RepID=A0ABW3YTA8_9ACTN